MKTKLIAFDLDGTLLNQEHQLAAKTIEAVKKVREKGIITLVATGRMFISALPHIEKLAVKSPVITYNGALVMDPQKKEIIYHQPIPLAVARQITEMVEENNYHLNIYLDDKLYVKELNKFSDDYEKISGIKSEPVGNLVDFIDQDPTKMLIVEEDEQKQQEINKFLIDNFADQIEISASFNSFIEMTKKGISKDVPLQKIAADFGIKQEEVMAFGDGLNDLKMIEWAGRGVAMANANPMLQEAADDIAPNHDKLGIARYLKKEFNLDLELDLA